MASRASKESRRRRREALHQAWKHEEAQLAKEAWAAADRWARSPVGTTYGGIMPAIFAGGEEESDGPPPMES